jgi:hypothetical protein
MITTSREHYQELSYRSFKGLKILSLQHNVFHGDLPMQMLGELDHLREIWLTNNHFSGEHSVYGIQLKETVKMEQICRGAA